MAAGHIENLYSTLPDDDVRALREALACAVWWRKVALGACIALSALIVTLSFLGGRWIATVEACSSTAPLFSLPSLYPSLAPHSSLTPSASPQPSAFGALPLPRAAGNSQWAAKPNAGPLGDADSNRCVTNAEGTAICWHDLPVCYDGLTPVIIDERWDGRGNGAEAERVMLQPRMAFSNVHQRFEGDSQGRGHVRHAGKVAVISHIPASVQVVWRDSVVLLQGPGHLANIYVTASTFVGPLNEIVRLRGEGLLPPTFLPNDLLVLVMNSDRVKHWDLTGNATRWAEHVAKAVLQWAGFENLDGLIKTGWEVRKASLRGGSGGSAADGVPATWRGGADDAVGVDPKHRWICGRRGIVAERFAFPTAGRLDTRQLRMAVARYLRVPYQEKLWRPQGEDTRPVGQRRGRLLVLDRHDTRSAFDRRIDNLDQMRRVIDQYAREVDVTYAVINETTPIRDQYTLFSTADAVIAGHGAGLTNAIFMREGAALMEIFPLQVYRTPYTRLATASGLNYIALYSNMQGAHQSWTYRRGLENFDAAAARALKERCCNATRVGASADGDCWPELLHTSIHVPVFEFGSALFNLLSLANVPISHPPPVEAFEVGLEQDKEGFAVAAEGRRHLLPPYAVGPMLEVFEQTKSKMRRRFTLNMSDLARDFRR